MARSALWTATMRDDCCTACHIAVGFHVHRVFDKANSLPWSLCVGDIEGNLRQLEEADLADIPDSICFKIRSLLRTGAPRPVSLPCINYLIGGQGRYSMFRLASFGSFGQPLCACLHWGGASPWAQLPFFLPPVFFLRGAQPQAPE